MRFYKSLRGITTRSLSSCVGPAAFALAFAGCGTEPGSSPVAPSGPGGTNSSLVSTTSEWPFGAPAPGHAFVLMLATGRGVVVSGRAEELPAPFGQCGIEWTHTQPVRALFSCSGPGCADIGPPEPLLTTADIPLGVHTVTFARYCSPYNIYDVDFSHP